MGPDYEPTPLGTDLKENYVLLVKKHRYVSWLIETELMWERDRDQNGLLYIMSNLHTAAYVGT